MNLTRKVIADQDSFEEFQSQLKAAGLPNEDLNYQDHVLVNYFDGDSLIGTGGLEIYGEYGLLRSLSVKEEFRKKSLGSYITDDLIEHARRNEIRGIYLLTETAHDFFARKGFRDWDREKVPGELAQSSEFSHVCPASAVCMFRPLQQQ